MPTFVLRCKYIRKHAVFFLKKTLHHSGLGQIVRMFRIVGLANIWFRFCQYNISPKRPLSSPFSLGYWINVWMLTSRFCHSFCIIEFNIQKITLQAKPFLFVRFKGAACFMVRELLLQDKICVIRMEERLEEPSDSISCELSYAWSIRQEKKIGKFTST